MAAEGRRRLRWLLLVGALLACAIGSAAVGFMWNIDRAVNDHLTRVDGAFPAESGRPAPTAGRDGKAPTTILVLGAQSLPLSATVAGYASDTIMLVRIAADRSRVDVVSIPPDSFVPIPGYGTDRISAATTRGGLPLAVQSVEGLTGSRVDHVAVVDLDAVSEVTDALGGVEVDVRHAFTVGRTRIPAGTTRLDGAAAAVLVREQRSLDGGALDRAENQQSYLAGLAEEVTGAGVVAQPTKLRDVLSLSADNVVVDSDLSSAALRGLAFGLRNLRGDDVHLWSAPVDNVRRAGNGPLTITLSEPGLQQLRHTLAGDSFASYTG